MGRPHTEFIHSASVTPVPAPSGPFAGLNWRVLSEDDETGAVTALAVFQAGWAAYLGGVDRRMEFLVLRGCLQLDGKDVAAGTYVDVPAWPRQAMLSAATNTQVLVMIEESQACPAEPGHDDHIEVIDTHDRPLEQPGPHVPPGLVVKRLRADAETGDMTWLGAGTPEYLESRAEVHPTAEEAFVLRGDVLVGKRGEMGPGDYFWRPPNVPHGPLYCRAGRLIFFRSKGGALETTYQEVPGWLELVAEYRTREPFYRG